MCAVICTLEQPAQLFPSIRKASVDRFGIPLAVHAPPQAVVTGGTFVDTAFTGAASLGHDLKSLILSEIASRAAHFPIW
jgi:hypothetical protein